MAETETDVLRDKIDVLIDALNAAVPTIPYARDAMDLDTPEDWGAVELNGGDGFDADGITIDMEYRANVWTVTEDRGTEVMFLVQDVLQAFQERWFGFRWQFPERIWLNEINRVAWKWTVRIPGPLDTETDTEDEAEDPAGDEAETPADGEADPAAEENAGETEPVAEENAGETEG